MKNSLFLFIFLFVNLYFPVSPILVTAFDILVAGTMLSKRASINVTYITSTAIILLVMAFLSFSFSLKPESQVLFKYARNVIATIVLIKAASNINVEIKTFNAVVSIVLFLHVATIAAQVIYPSLSTMIAPYFNYSRDMDMLMDMQLRKLGLSGGYDASSMLVVTAVIFFYYQFYYKKTWIYLLLSIASMAMTLFVSRTGMLIAAAAMAYFVVASIRKKGRLRVAGIGMTALCGAAMVYLVLPILASTNGLLLDISVNQNADVSYFTQDYSSANGSARNLTYTHLLFLNDLSFSEWILGAGNSSSSDIGYIQMIFQVGLVGLLLILIMHFKMFKMLRQMDSTNEDFNILRTFCMVYLVALFVFNYKILLLYSRGFYDFILICFVYIVNYYYTNRDTLVSSYE